MQDSFKTCIKALWVGVNPGSKVFIHDVDRKPIVEVFTNSDWWRNEIGVDPPQFIGAYHGLGRLSSLIGYVIKT